MEKVHLRLKEQYMPKVGKFIHTRGMTRIEVSSTDAHEFEIKEARIALDLRDDAGERKFELASPPPPVRTETELPPDYPHREKLLKNYGTMEAITAATDEDLLEVSGIGKASLAEIRAYEPRPINLDASEATTTEEGDTE